eukprot:COSAG06_NODE_44877_length_359_cov_1.265385_1_plen_24_part_10
MGEQAADPASTPPALVLGICEWGR